MFKGSLGSGQAGFWKAKQPQYKWAAMLWLNLEINVRLLSEAVEQGLYGSHSFIPYCYLSPGGSNKSDTYL